LAREKSEEGMAPRSPATPPIDALPVYRNHKNWQWVRFKRKEKKKKKNWQWEKHVSVISQLAALNEQKLGASLSAGAQGQGLHLFFYSSLALDVDFY
jgi:hypothetical protein